MVSDNLFLPTATSIVQPEHGSVGRPDSKLEEYMIKSEKVANILAILESLYPEPPIPLNHRDPYTLLVAVLLSAQCTDERVNKVTPALFKEASNPQAMSELSVDTIQGCIQSCGLAPRKAKAIHGLSRILVEKHNSTVPADFDALEALPGVGHKTASVVMAQAFDIPAFPVDTHIHRCAYRWALSTGKNVERTEQDLKRLIPIELWNKCHLQIIFFGREYCPARGHSIPDCPICSRFGRKGLVR